MKKRNYIIVTPVKDEEKNITNSVSCVVNQSIKPSLWVIIDDGSTDRTLELVRGAGRKHSCIKIIRLPEGKRDLGLHYAYVCKQGFNYAIRFCEKTGINWDYISLLDADIILGEDYFEKLIKEFEKNQRLGLASGKICDPSDNKFFQVRIREDIPRGANRVWRRKCFEETNGYIITYAPDSVSTVKAKIKGWDTRQFGDIFAIQARPTSSAEGLWKGYKIRGKTTYHLWYHPIHVFLRGLNYLFQPKFYLAFLYFIGYFSSLIHKKPRIEDEEIKNYFRKQRLKELVDVYLVKK